MELFSIRIQRTFQLVSTLLYELILKGGPYFFKTNSFGEPIFTVSVVKRLTLYPAQEPQNKTIKNKRDIFMLLNFYGHS